MNYYIGDLHLNHKHVCGEGRNFDGRPFKTLDEMHKVIKDSWNSRITNGDAVYLLGDVIWRPTDEMIGFFAQLKGNKILIKGNHDRITDSRYRQLFAEICDYKEITDHADKKNYNLVLSHYPIYSWNGMHKNWIHLYGHVHNTYEDIMYQKALKDLGDYYKNRDGEKYKPFYAFNVGCMQPYMNYVPRTLQEILDPNLKNTNGDHNG